MRHSFIPNPVIMAGKGIKQYLLWGFWEDCSVSVVITPGIFAVSFNSDDDTAD